jgi:hypothetical protein
MDLFIYEILGSKAPTKFDFPSGNHQLRLAGETISIPVFLTYFGLCESLLLHFAMSNAPEASQTVMTIF